MAIYVVTSTKPVERNPDLVILNTKSFDGGPKLKQLMKDRYSFYKMKRSGEVSFNGGHSIHRALLVSINPSFDDITRNLSVANKWYKNIFKYAISKKIESIELSLLLSNPESLILEELELFLKLASRYVRDYNISIGLLVPSSKVVEDNFELFNKYHVYICKTNSDTAKHYKVEKKEPDFDIRYSVVMDVNRTPIMRKASPKPFPVDEESFIDKLFRYLEKSNKSNAEVYTKGLVSKQVFSNAINPNKGTPNKTTIICLIVGMELCLDDALDLLNSAGYTLSSSIPLDCIVKKYIQEKHFSIYDLNEELDTYGIRPIGNIER